MLGYTENELPHMGVGKRRKHVEEARGRLRNRTYLKNGILHWAKDGKPVMLATFADAYCTPNSRQAKALKPPRRRGLLLRLSEAQNHRCCFCGVETTYHKCHDHTATIEHLIPVAHGGPDTWENCVMSCWTCNNKRKTLDPMLFFEGRLWEPGRAIVRKLINMMAAFQRNPDVRILKAMPCCNDF
jgi:5-methylcytosine-specific restriction endonuclease McrA